MCWPWQPNGCSTVIAKLLSAGAVDPEGFDEPLRCALFRPEPRICALLLRAGAKLCTKWNQLSSSVARERSPLILTEKSPDPWWHSV